MTTEINKEKVLEELRKGTKTPSDLSYSEKKSLLKEIEFVNPDRMYVGSGHKTFDRQTTLIAPGNVWGSTVFSSYIRAFNETECNGRSNPNGHLQAFDLKPFNKFDGFRTVKDFIEKSSPDDSFILYALFSYNGDKRMVHGFTLTNQNYKHIKNFYTPVSNKSYDVIDTVEPYLAYRL